LCRGFSIKGTRHISLVGILFFSRDLVTKGISFNLGSIHGWNVQELLAGGDWSSLAA
jgi:hypothetical protein